jgi:hypothetical protein
MMGGRAAVRRGVIGMAATDRDLAFQLELEGRSAQGLHGLAIALTLPLTHQKAPSAKGSALGTTACEPKGATSRRARKHGRMGISVDHKKRQSAISSGGWSPAVPWGPTTV